MSRISQEELDQLKHEISLERLVTAKGISLKRHGQDLIGHCPFHNDKTPSFVVSPKNNLWHCLGACQQGGSVIDWVMKSEGVSFRHAIELLREDSPSLAAPLESKRGGRPAEDGRDYTKHSTVTHLKTTLPADIDTQGALKHAIAYYHETLKNSPEALEYLQSRGLTSSEMIERFQLGYCDRTLCYRLPKRNRKDGAAIRASLQESGILRSSGHEHFRGSLVIPIFDESGNIIEAYGRKIKNNLRSGTNYHLYLPGPHRGVWNLEALKASKEIILCESLIDALTFWCAGFRNVTTSYGIEGFTPEHLVAFKEHGIERIMIAYDRDEAGQKATKKLAEKLTTEGFECFGLKFPHKMDANSFAQTTKPAHKALGLVIRNAEWLGQGAGPKTKDQAAGPEPLKIEAGQEPSPQIEPPVSLAAPSKPPEPQAAQNPEAPQAEVNEEEVIMHFGPRRWRIRGLNKNLAYDVLKINVLCSMGETFHVDTLDLYSARHRMSFLKMAASELKCDERILKKDLGQVLLKLESLQEERIESELKPKDETPTMSDADRSEALNFLKDPKLIERILEDFDSLGLVGESTNKLCGYLASISRKLQKPLAVLVQSTSAAGKSALMEAVLALVPSEECIKYSAMTGQSLFYMGETNLKHKILAIVEEEGAERASYALKLLQSEGELVIASTGKEPTSGRLITHEYRVEGPVMIFLTTTAIDIDEELLNRCLVLTVDEGGAQTQAIHHQQRLSRTLEGLKAKHQKQNLRTLHQNAQRLLRPISVVNPFADKLNFPHLKTRTRRDHEKYLTLIDAIALLHQHQRPIQKLEHGGATVEYIEATAEDIAIANQLSQEVIARSLDELPPQTRRMLEAIESLVAQASNQNGIDRVDVRFSRREIREHTGFSLTQVRVHLARLVELELLWLQQGRDGQRFLYALSSKSPKTKELPLSSPDGTTATWRGWRPPGGADPATPKSLKNNENTPTWRPDDKHCSPDKKTSHRNVAIPPQNHA